MSAPVAEAPPPPEKQSATPGDFDLGSWQKKLSNFASNPASKQFRVHPATEVHSEEASAGFDKIVNLAALKVEWHQFLDHLVRKSHNLMATHLESCELVSCSPSGGLEISCCRKFSFEELLQERATLQQEMSEFYTLPIQLRLHYDAEKDACTREKTVFTLFQELSQNNEVVRFLVTEFGGELVY